MYGFRICMLSGHNLDVFLRTMQGQAAAAEAITDSRWLRLLYFDCDFLAGSA